MMIKYIIILALQINFLGAFTSDKFLISDSFVHLLYKRYYLIQKLQPLFKELKSSSFFYSSKLKEMEVNDILHPLIIQSTKRIKQQSNLQSLFNIWDSFTQYKNLEDKEFTHDFLKEIEEVVTIVKFHEIIPFTIFIKENSDDFFLAVDNVKSNNGCKRVVEAFDAVQTQTVLHRFYYIQRLEVAIKGILLGNIGIIYIEKIPFVLNDNTLILGSITFTDYRIINCFKQMIIEKNFKIFEKLWDYCKSYQAIDDLEFEKEFALFTYYWYQIMVEKFNTDLVMNKITYKANIADLPLEDILDALDYLTDELPLFLEKYEFKSELTWKEWVKKYWLIAPIAVAGFAIRMYLNLKKGK